MNKERHLFLECLSGVLKEGFVEPILDPDFYTNITAEVDNKWKQAHNGKDVKETIREYLVMYLGEPITQLLRY